MHLVSVKPIVALRHCFLQDRKKEQNREIPYNTTCSYLASSPSLAASRRTKHPTSIHSPIAIASAVSYNTQKPLIFYMSIILHGKRKKRKPKTKTSRSINRIYIPVGPSLQTIPYCISSQDKKKRQ